MIFYFEACSIEITHHYHYHHHHITYIFFGVGTGKFEYNFLLHEFVEEKRLLYIHM